MHVVCRWRFTRCSQQDPLCFIGSLVWKITFSHVFVTRSWKHPSNLRIEKYAREMLTFVALGYFPFIVKQLFWITTHFYILDLRVQAPASQPQQVIGVMHVVCRWRFMRCSQKERFYVIFQYSVPTSEAVYADSIIKNKWLMQLRETKHCLFWELYKTQIAGLF
jgi:hypothetical protein